MPQMTITLSDAAAALIQEKVESGDYLDASAVLEEFVRRVSDEDAWLRGLDSSEVEHWLRTEVVASYDNMRRNPGQGFTAEEVLEKIGIVRPS
jgi:antitoxin ParD1/3/4